MTLDQLLEPLRLLSCPPPGSINVRIGDPVEGPGGRWIPCASAIAGGAFVSCIYQVGPGQRQVCAWDPPTYCEEEALARAVDLAITAAA